MKSHAKRMWILSVWIELLKLDGVVHHHRLSFADLVHDIGGASAPAETKLGPWDIAVWSAYEKEVSTPSCFLQASTNDVVTKEPQRY